MTLPTSDQDGVDPALPCKQAYLPTGVRQMIEGIFHGIEVAPTRYAVANRHRAAAAEVAQRAEPFTTVVHAGPQFVVLIEAPADERQRGEEVPGAGGRRFIEQLPRDDKLRRVGPGGDDPEIARESMIAEGNAAALSL